MEEKNPTGGQAQPEGQNSQAEAKTEAVTDPVESARRHAQETGNDAAKNFETYASGVLENLRGAGATPEEVGRVAFALAHTKERIARAAQTFSENIAPLPIVFSIRGYQLTGESSYLLEAGQTSDMLRLRVSFRQKYTGWEYALGTRYALGDDLFLDVHATIQRGRAVPEKFDVTEVTVQSYDLSKPPPVGAFEAKFFAIFANLSWQKGSPYVDRFGTISLGVSKRLDFN